MLPSETRCPGGDHQPFFVRVCRLCGAEDDNPWSIWHIVGGAVLLVFAGILLGAAVMLK